MTDDRDMPARIASEERVSWVAPSYTRVDSSEAEGADVSTFDGSFYS